MKKYIILLLGLIIIYSLVSQFIIKKAFISIDKTLQSQIEALY